MPTRFSFRAAVAGGAIAALAALGLGYAAFTDAITITGSATGGTLNEAWSAVGHSTNNPGNGNQAACTAVIDNVGGAQKNITGTITNAYPGFACTITGTIHQYGTVAGTITTVGNAGSPQLAIDDSSCLTLVGSIVGPDKNCTIVVTYQGSPGGSYGFTETVTFTSP